MVWDIIAKIATRELEIKEKTTKGHKEAHEKTPAKRGCEHHHEGECTCHEHHACEHNHSDCCCNHTKH